MRHVITEDNPLKKQDLPKLLIDAYVSKMLKSSLTSTSFSKKTLSRAAMSKKLPMTPTPHVPKDGMMYTLK